MSYVPAASIKAMLAQGNVKIVGHPVADGRRTVELSVSLGKEGKAKTNYFYVDSHTFQLVRLALINPYVAALSPRLLWRVQDEWDMLGFQLIKGHHADHAPGSPEILAVTRLMTALGGIRCPRRAGQAHSARWRDYVDDSRDLDWLDGDRLVHTDWNPSNVLITGRGCDDAEHDN